ncbi:MAG: hypothetical protein WED07_07535 [Candidatus Freyarchaeum deiterrae]
MKIPKIGLPAGLSPILAFGIVLAIILFVMGGGVYVITSNPSFNNPSGTSIVSSSLSGQYGIEAVLSIAFMFVGFVGFLLIYESTKHVYNASLATKLLVMGMVLVAVSTFLLYWMVIPKAPWIFRFAGNSG